MNTNSTLLPGILSGLGVLLSVTLPLTAQPTAPETFNHLEKAGDVIGMMITDSTKQEVGKVTELAIDWQAARVAEVLVDTGGYLTTHQRIAAVPPEVLNFDESGKQLRLKADVDDFDNAPECDLATLGKTAGVDRPSPNKADFENLIRMDDAMENGFLLLRSTYLC